MFRGAVVLLLTAVSEINYAYPEHGLFEYLLCCRRPVKELYCSKVQRWLFFFFFLLLSGKATEQSLKFHPLQVFPSSLFPKFNNLFRIALKMLDKQADNTP